MTEMKIKGRPFRLLLVLTMMLLGACGSPSDAGPNEREATSPSQVGSGDSQASADARCSPPDARPHYLPWLEDDEEIPPPRETYDEEIDRIQLGWQDPRFAEGKAGIGLTLYPLPSGVSGGSPTGVEVAGVEGLMHVGEGDSVSMSWDLPADCNFLELIISNPQLDVGEQKEQLLRVARSLR